MKHPLWLVNSILLFILVCVLGLIVLLRPKKVLMVPYEPEETTKPLALALPKIDLQKIYQHDLFDTYREPVVPTIKEPEAPTMPQPPHVIPTPPSVKPSPKLLEPLQVSLKGIMLTGDDATNIAMIEDAQTKQSKNYKINDKIEDAQLIRILKNKIIIVRSNGQQETLYVNQHDAELEQLLSPHTGWSEVIAKEDENNFSIDPDAFVAKIRNVAQLIDILNLTTVYRQGKSIGCRVGRVPANSLATALGLQTGDIITSVNGIPATDTDNRYAIYQSVTTLHIGDTITIEIQRNAFEYTITYNLKELVIPNKMIHTPSLQEVVHPQKTMQDVQKERERIMRERYRFAPTQQQLQQQQKRNMMHNARSRHPRNRNMLTRQLEP